MPSSKVEEEPSLFSKLANLFVPTLNEPIVQVDITDDPMGFNDSAPIIEESTVQNSKSKPIHISTSRGNLNNDSNFMETYTPTLSSSFDDSRMRNNSSQSDSNSNSLIGRNRSNSDTFTNFFKKKDDKER
ncbi:hypothetical protein ABK040_012926 [Willaertia magna]